MKAFKEYSKHHLWYAKLIQKRNINYKLNDERYYKMRGKLQEWLDHSIQKGKVEN